MLGHAEQGYIRAEVHLEYRDWVWGEDIAFGSWNPNLEASVDEWLLLLQVDTDDDADMLWETMGRSSISFSSRRLYRGTLMAPGWLWKVAEPVTYRPNQSLHWTRLQPIGGFAPAHVLRASEFRRWAPLCGKLRLKGATMRTLAAILMIGSLALGAPASSWAADSPAQCQALQGVKKVALVVDPFPEQMQQDGLDPQQVRKRSWCASSLSRT